MQRAFESPHTRLTVNQAAGVALTDMKPADALTCLRGCMVPLQGAQLPDTYVSYSVRQSAAGLHNGWN
jgi:hypothetical protein